MANPTQVVGEDLSQRELVSTRIFNFPREKVFAVWTDPKAIPHFWGPNGFSTTIHEYDFRVGGHWRLTMHGPDGKDYPNLLIFVEITPPSRLVFNHVTAPLFRSTVTFDELKGKTKVTMRMLFETPEIYTNVTKVAVDGNEQLFDRLTEVLNASAK